jgi:tripartite-type tricarboxylate transporter receptor subunit TctC
MKSIASLPTRRHLLRVAGSACALAAFPRIAKAQAFPTRPVRLIVGQAAGSGSDILARLIAQWLSDRLGQQFVVDNRPGAGGNLGAEAVARSTADGYTLLLITSTNVINTALNDNLNFNVVRDIAAIATVTLTPYALVANPAFTAMTVPDLIEYAKGNPGKVNMASGGSGSVSHVAGELFKQMAGVDVVHVPYRGSTPAHMDLIGGQVQVMFDAMTTSLDHIKAGRLRVLAVTSATRSALLPNVPTVADFVSGYDVTAWLGIGAPANTPIEVVELLNKEISLALADPRIRSRLIELGGSVLATSPVEFTKLIADDARKWRGVVTFAGLKPQ